MKTKTVTLIEVEYNDLDDQITKFLNEKGIKWKHPKDARFECIAEEEWGNDESHALDVDGKVDDYDKKEILAGELSWKTAAILNWMASEGVVPKGTYKVDICW